ncbi:hypothetical protein NB694_003917 [Pantoea ananatis]|uniref:HD domain-containing protein n=1 Tax=Pantoea ananas TaxID=553 RepID=UPI0021F70394|nr:HD domain-containing protein [Pantoea ananatis]MCW0314117.1 hypothetical protein [Pantoea ananatis]
MNLTGTFEQNLVSKILDPIHGVIRMTEDERKVIDEPLFQRLRNVRQNTLLYKVFPSAVHSRFEHSIGVMHLSYELLKNLSLNIERYRQKKYACAEIYSELKELPQEHIVNLRLAALLHDVGHGPLAHLFDKFSIKTSDLKIFISKEKDLKKKERYEKILQLCNNDERLEHEKVSCIFAIEILHSAKLINVDIDGVIKLIESKYDYDYPLVNGVNIHKLLTSLISSCPIDADRMDYMLRDSYFSGVKYGIYDYSRLLMSLVPMKIGNDVFLTFKESGIDSLLEFINARSNLFSQVYFHKTNRFFTKALKQSCANISYDVINFDFKKDFIEQLKYFYFENSDNVFLEKCIYKNIEEKFKSEPSKYKVNKKLIDDIIGRKVWKKVFEKKVIFSNLELSMSNIGDFENKINLILEEQTLLHKDLDIIVDVVSENNFKDITDSSVKILKKDVDDSYSLHDFFSANDIFQVNHRIKFIARVYLNDNQLSLDKVSYVKASFKEIDKKIQELYAACLPDLKRRLIDQ